MPTPSRMLYAAQRATLYVTGSPRVLAIQSAALDISNPIDDVLVFGKIGSANRVQKEVSKTKITLKYFPMVEAGLGSGLSATDVQTLINESLSGTYSTIVVEPNGFTGSGILTNMSFDASVNSFVSSDLTFEGLGTPAVSAPVGTISSDSYNDAGGFIPTTVTPITHNLVSLYGSDFTTPLSGTIANAKFSFDIPNETLSSLGSTIIGSQAGSVFSGNRILAKPPFKATLTVDGTSAEPAYKANFSALAVKLPKGIVTSKSYNQGVGTIGATYSYTIEDVNVEWS